MLQSNGWRLLSLLGFYLMVLSGCGGGGGGGSTAATAWTVTAIAGPNGTITPSSRTVSNGTTTTFTVTPADGYAISSVTGCGGTLSGNTFATAPVNANCTVTASFATPYTISGSVTGLAWGYGIVLHNNGGDPVTVNDTPAGSEQFSFPVAIGDGGSYAVTVASHPTGMKCEVSNGMGSVNGSNVTNVTITCKDEVLALYPVNGANWNDYVLNDGADPWKATGSACSGDETGGHSLCIHGGERRVFAVAGAQSCLGLTASDVLNAFNWRCDGSQGYVRFISSNLKDDKRLADLIDFNAPAWKENIVTVKNGGVTVATSASTQWWTNPLVADNNGMASSEMNSEGTIYLVTSNAHGSYEIGANKIALAIKPDTTLRGNGTGASVISANGKKFVWIEGNVNAIYDAKGVSLSTVGFSVLRNAKVVNASDYGVYLESSKNNRLQNILASNSTRGIGLISSSYNRLNSLTAVSNENTGFYMSGYSNNNLVDGVTAENNGSTGMFLELSYRNIISGVNAGNSMYGLYGYQSWGNTYTNITSVHNSFGVKLLDSSYERFTDLLKVGNNSTDCVVSGAGIDPGLINGTCENQGTSNAFLTSGISLVISFVGKVSDDASNISDVNGVAAYPEEPAAFDWLNFSNGFRAWGRDGSEFPSGDNSGAWSDGNGHIWDWSLATVDTTLKSTLTLPVGNGVNSHTWTDGVISQTVTYLRHAAELDGDGDGLCESNEMCLYTPNIGSYQGHGALVSYGTFTDGTITGVTLLKYESNGR